VSSLSRHLTTPAPHGELPFHPGCPTCRDTRLHGTIPDGPIVPARVKASLATALVTVSTAGAAPGISLAQEVDEQLEGTELPQPKPQQAPDPGDETRVADDESVAVPGLDGGDAEDDSEGPALESEPDAGPPPREAPAAPAPPENVEVPSPPASAPPAAPLPPSPPAEPMGREADEPRRHPTPHRGGAKAAPAPKTPTATPAPVPPLAATPLEAPRSLPGGNERAAATPTPSEQPGTAPLGKKHTVKPGESLWSIAAGLAGDDATPANIARIVNRLWTINADRIGTGNPDLVMAGTTLRIP